jgi:hypothetical protein
MQNKIVLFDSVEHESNLYLGPNKISLKKKKKMQIHNHLNPTYHQYT